MKQKRKRYTDEFKHEAARMVIMEGLSAPAVAEKLGVSSVQVYRWKDDYLKNMGGTGDNGEMSPKDMAAELDLVRKQLAREKRINEILKKTVGYFAKDEE